jgi:hypothetical protein
MSAPDSRVGGSAGWALIIAVILVAVYDTGYKPKRTLYYHYRPEGRPKSIDPWVTALIWTAALVLIAVSYVYFLTVEANSGWVDELFPGEKYGYDVMAALILVNLFLIKAFPAFFCTMDMFHYMTVDKNAESDSARSISSTAVESQAVSQGIATLRNRNYSAKVSPLLNQPSKPDAIDVDAFYKESTKYHHNNYFVKVGTFVYAVAVLGFGVTIYAFFITKFSSSAKHAHSYQVSTWTYFVALLVQVFGVIYTGYMNFTGEVKDFNVAVIQERQKELLMS